MPARARSRRALLADPGWRSVRLSNASSSVAIAWAHNGRSGPGGPSSIAARQYTAASRLRPPPRARRFVAGRPGESAGADVCQRGPAPEREIACQPWVESCHDARKERMFTATFQLPEAASLVPATSGHVWPIRRCRCGDPAALYVAGVCLNRIGVDHTKAREQPERERLSTRGEQRFAHRRGQARRHDHFRVLYCRGAVRPADRGARALRSSIDREKRSRRLAQYRKARRPPLSMRYFAFAPAASPRRHARASSGPGRRRPAREPTPSAGSNRDAAGESGPRAPVRSRRPCPSA